MERFKWFWITLGCWCLIGATSAWALIYSSTHLATSTVSEFTAQVNESTVHNQILVTSNSMELSRDLLSSEWREDDWKLVSGKLNLARVLFKTPNALSAPLDSLTQVQVFQKGDTLRLLALWNDIEHGQTYQWITETPKKVLEPPDPAKVPFPFHAPANARDLLFLKAKNTEVLTWFSKERRDPEMTLRALYLSQGFSGRRLCKKSGESLYILQKGSTRLLGAVEKGTSQNAFTFVKLKIR